jgi:CRP-like cAMP-binding protein
LTPLHKGTISESSGTLPELEASQIFKSLPQSDWEQLLQGAKTITVAKDAVIITQGEEYQRIFQINSGLCRIEINKEGKRVRLGSMGQDETFGEISFLNGGSGASAHVIADVDDSTLY